MDAIRDLIRSAERTVDIINPYWSEMMIDRLLSGFSSDHVRFRVLTVLNPSNIDGNSRAIRAFIDAVRAVGSSVAFYSPTPAEIAATDAIAPIHAKVIIRDGNRCYIGSANLSKGGLETGLEIGAIHSGPCVSRLVQYCDWIFDNSEVIDLDY